MRGELLEIGEPWQGDVDRGPLLVVCDGMGGVEGGEVASELAARSIWREMKGTSGTRDPEVFARCCVARRASRTTTSTRWRDREPGLQGHGHDGVGRRRRRQSAGDRDGRRLARVRAPRGADRAGHARSVAVVGAARGRPRSRASGARGLARSCRRSASAMTSNRRSRSSSCAAAIACCCAATVCTASSAIRRCAC